MRCLFHLHEPGAGPAVTATPALFISHGAPTVLLQEDGYFQALRDFAGRRAAPAAVLILSAHWLGDGPVEITAPTVHETIHDYYGFPKQLYGLRYPAPGSEQLARAVETLLKKNNVHCRLNPARGLDHGAWVPLSIMFPSAAVPVTQISLPYPAPPERLFALGEMLAPLRASNVWIVGSGAMTHNLARLDLRRKDAPPAPEAAAFDAWVMEKVRSDDGAELFEYAGLAPYALLMHPTSEHLLPLFFTLGAARPGDRLATIFDGIHFGALSMRSFALEGAAAGE